MEGAQGASDNTGPEFDYETCAAILLVFGGLLVAWGDAEDFTCRESEDNVAQEGSRVNVTADSPDLLHDPSLFDMPRFVRVIGCLSLRPSLLRPLLPRPPPSPRASPGRRFNARRLASTALALPVMRELHAARVISPDVQAPALRHGVKEWSQRTCLDPAALPRQWLLRGWAVVDVLFFRENRPARAPPRWF